MPENPHGARIRRPAAAVRLARRGLSTPAAGRHSCVHPSVLLFVFQMLQLLGIMSESLGHEGFAVRLCLLPMSSAVDTGMRLPSYG